MKKIIAKDNFYIFMVDILRVVFTCEAYINKLFSYFFQIEATNLQFVFTNITLEPFSILSSDKLSSVTSGTPRNEAQGSSTGRFGAAGAGHGGNSGQGYSQNIIGVAYGNFRYPRHQGSRGGKSVFPFNSVAKGGGRLSLHASHTLVIDGELSSKGKIVGHRYLEL